MAKILAQINVGDTDTIIRVEEIKAGRKYQVIFDHSRGIQSDDHDGIFGKMGDAMAYAASIANQVLEEAGYG